jgi:hypothetical protein
VAVQDSDYGQEQSKTDSKCRKDALYSHQVLLVTFQFYEQSGATHFRLKINNPTKASPTAQGDAQRFTCQ